MPDWKAIQEQSQALKGGGLRMTETRHCFSSEERGRAQDSGRLVC